MSNSSVAVPAYTYSFYFVGMSLSVLEEIFSQIIIAQFIELHEISGRKKTTSIITVVPGCFSFSLDRTFRPGLRLVSN